MAAAVAAVGVLGAIVGSFLNVVIHRLPERRSLVHPRSRCPACRAQIASRDNIPVLSWMVLRGRCRSCGEPIPIRYPAIEALTAAVFAGIAAARGVDSELALLLPFAAVLIAVAAIDLEHRIVPNRIVAPAALWALAAGALLRGSELPGLALAAALAFCLLLLVALAYPAGMGMGDVKLAGVMGLYLGAAVAPALLSAFFAGSVIGIAMIARHGAAARKLGVPFAPFLAGGGIVGVLFGPQLVDLYVSAFLS